MGGLCARCSPGIHARIEDERLLRAAEGGGCLARVGRVLAWMDTEGLIERQAHRAAHCRPREGPVDPELRWWVGVRPFRVE